MNKQLGLAVIVAALAGAGIFLWSNPDNGMQEGSQSGVTAPRGAPMTEVTLPDSLSEMAQIGERAFNAVCAECHGDNAAGRQGKGPPLVHKIYEPSHHGDMSFHLAVQNGVRAHHWSFGNMPPQSGLTKSDVAAIVTYVRELQQENGIN